MAFVGEDRAAHVAVAEKLGSFKAVVDRQYKTAGEALPCFANPGAGFQVHFGLLIGQERDAVAFKIYGERGIREWAGLFEEAVGAVADVEFAEAGIGADDAMDGQRVEKFIREDNAVFDLRGKIGLGLEFTAGCVRGEEANL
jgi:hypothetical protein